MDLNFTGLPGGGFATVRAGAVGLVHEYLEEVDAGGAETTAIATLRDFVRFGELMCNQGRVDETQVVPPEVVASIVAGGDRDVFARAGFGRTCPTARGAHGQLLYLDPANDLVIARFGSSPDAPSYLTDHILLPTIDAICAELTQ